MLKLSKGKEEALLAQIANKYPGINLEAIRRKVQTELNPPEEDNKKKKGIPIWSLILGGVAAVILIIWLVFPGSDKKDNDIGKLYVIADWIYARSEPRIKKVTNTGEQILYGQELPVFDIIANNGEKWIKTLYKLDTVYVLHRYLGTEKEKIEVASIFGNSEAGEEVQDSYAKRGVLAFMNASNFMGNLSEEEQIKVYGKKQDREIWQLFGLSKNVTFNIFAEGKFSGAYFGGYPTKYPYRYPDFGVILTNRNNRNERELLLFRNDQKAKPHKIGQFDLDDYPDHYIRTIEYNDPILKENFSQHRKKVTEDKPAILVGRNSYPDQAFLLVIEEGKIKKYN